MNKVNERKRTIKGYNLDLYDDRDSDGWFQMPIIFSDDVVPNDMIPFNCAMTSKHYDCGVHMFIDDYQFERLWNTPSKYVEILKRFKCVCTPDFSLYTDMPMAMKVWNTYRSRLLGQFWQSQGIRVIPTISWAEQETYKFCFDGIEYGCIVAISTTGIKRDKESLKIWHDGIDAMIEFINPGYILIYGEYIQHDFHGISVKWYKNHIVERARKMAKERV